MSPDLERRIADVRAAIARAALAAGRSVDSVTLLGVSKGQRAEVVQAAARAGVTQFGENYVAEAIAKIDAVADPALTWHFIGRVQANKTREIATRFQWVHGIDRLRVAQRLSTQRAEVGAALDVCVQVNIAGELTKGGVAPGEVTELLQAMAELPHLRLRGLMCLLPFEMTDPGEQRAAFDAMHALLRTPRVGVPALDTLSMGMSADFAPAIAAGATLVRIGTALFGPRYTDSTGAP